MSASVALMLLVPPGSITAHPIHMSYTQITAASPNSTALTIRVYANDFSAAAARFSRTSPGRDSTIDNKSALAYLSEKLRVGDANGALGVLASCGVTKVGDMLHFCFNVRGRVSRMTNTVMTELFHDQVNVVQLSKGGTRMFVKGEGWKSL